MFLDAIYDQKRKYFYFDYSVFLLFPTSHSLLPCPMSLGGPSGDHESGFDGIATAFPLTNPPLLG